MAASKLLRPAKARSGPAALVDRAFARFSTIYSGSLGGLIQRPLWVSVFLLAIVGAGWQLFSSLPQEYSPTEDRSSFFVLMNAPEGASFEYTQRYARDMENVLLPLLDQGEAYRVLISTPRFGSGAAVNNSIAIISLENWDQRERSTQQIVGSLFPALSAMPGVRAFPIQPGGLGQRGFSTPVQFVLGGDTYEDLAQWRDAFLGKASENPRLLNLDADYKEVKPQLLIEVDRNRAADLGVSVSEVGRTLETMLGSRRVTTYLDRGEEYDVILQAEDTDRRTPGDIENLYVRASKSGELVPLSSLVTVSEGADAATLNRFNRLRSITISANLAPGYTLGEALTYLRSVAEETLPTEARIDYKGQSRELQESSSSVLVTFALALLVVFLVLAAQFESFIHPLIIMLTVPLAVVGALLGLELSGGSLNIYSQIGIVMMVGLAAKNGILIVEFANQLRDAGASVEEAIREAARLRLRPIVMTSISTVIGVLPLILGGGAGAESRMAIGVVVFAGVLFSTVLTLGVVPTFYRLLAPYTRSPEAVTQTLEALGEAQPDRH
jgi:multidrug efflux pump